MDMVELKIKIQELEDKLEMEQADCKVMHAKLNNAETEMERLKEKNSHYCLGRSSGAATGRKRKAREKIEQNDDAELTESDYLNSTYWRWWHTARLSARGSWTPFPCLWSSWIFDKPAWTRVSVQAFPSGGKGFVSLPPEASVQWAGHFTLPLLSTMAAVTIVPEAEQNEDNWQESFPVREDAMRVV